MEMEKIREQLARLTELVAGWSESAEVSALERDLVLEKLRTLYETVRFPHSEGAAAEVVSATSEAPVSERVEAVEAVVAELPVAVAASAPEGECPARVLESAVTEIVVAEPEAAAGAANAVGPDVAASESVPKSEPEAAVCGAEISEPAEVPAETAAVIVAAPAEPGRAVFPEVDPAAVDPEVLAARRREKRRIIRSLYEADEVEEVCRFAEADRTSEAPRAEAAAAPTPEAAAEPAPQTDDIPDAAGLPAGTPAEMIAEEARAASVSELPVSELPAPQRDDIPDAAGLPAGTPAEMIAEEEGAAPASEPSAESVSEPLPAPQPEPASGPEERSSAVSEFAPKPGAVLGEVIGGGPVLGETIPAAASVASEIVRREPIADLREAIGINDRFLLVRDLFAGDRQACERAIDSLNGFDDLDDCLVFIAETYDWNPASEGAKLLMELLERKLG